MPNFKLIFADRTDKYYCRGLMKLDLNSYIWLRLHSRDGFDSVYFIQKEDQSGLLKCSEYGGRAVKMPAAPNSFFTSKKKKIADFSSWMNLQLKDKKFKNAVVFEIDDFCELIKDSVWKETLIKLNNDCRSWIGSIVLIIPPVVVHARNRLLYEEIFSVMKDESLTRYRNTSQPVHDYFSALKNEKGPDCEFYNLYTFERMQALFDYIIFREGKWKFPEGQSTYNTMIEYLVQYLNNRRLQFKDNLRLGTEMLINPTYSDLHSQLTTADVWRTLTERAQKINSLGKLKTYLSTNNIEYVHESSIQTRISYEKGSYAYRCMGISPLNLSNSSNDSLSDLEKKLGYTGTEMINNIYTELNKPCNCIENDQAVQTINILLPKLSNARGNHDAETHQRVLYCIQACVFSLFVPSEANNVLVDLREAIEQYTSVSSTLFLEKKTQNGVGIFGKANSKRNMVIAKERLLDKLDSLIVSKVQQTPTAFYDTSQATELLSELAKDMNTAIIKNAIDNPDDIDYGKMSPLSADHKAKKKVYEEPIGEEAPVEEELNEEPSQQTIERPGSKYGNALPPSFYF